MVRTLLEHLLVAGCLFAPFLADAQPASGRRVALVVGNGSYRTVAALTDPSRDAELVAVPLREMGFQVELLVDADRSTMLGAVARLSSSASGAEVALLFYAGHAMEVGGQNLLLPVSVSAASAAEVRRTSVSFAEISSALEGKARTTLIFLDACRDNPLRGIEVLSRGAGGRPGAAQPASRSLDGSGGLASVSSSSGMLIAFATAPGRVALDGNDRNSPFTQALVQHMKTPGLEVRQLLGDVRRTVRQTTSGQQVPWDNSSLEGTFYFVPPVIAGSAAARRFDAIWSVVFTCEPIRGTQGYVQRFAATVRDGRFEGRRGAESQPDSSLWQGTINHDGGVVIRVSGLTGNSRYNLDGLPVGTPFSFDVTAQFDEKTGRGVRVQQRPCIAEFARR